MFGSAWDGNGERCPLTNDATGAHRSAMQPNQFAHQRQANARTLLRAGLHIMRAVKTLKDMRQVFSGYTCAGVLHDEFNMVIDDVLRDGYLTIDSKFEGVGEQIEYD